MNSQILGNLPFIVLPDCFFWPQQNPFAVPATIKWSEFLLCLASYLFFSFAHLTSLLNLIFNLNPCANPSWIQCSWNAPFKTAWPNSVLFYGSSLIPSHNSNLYNLSTALENVSDNRYKEVVCMNVIIDADGIVDFCLQVTYNLTVTCSDILL